jgi:DNA-binding transcriptional ArsR family regulator
LAAGSLLWERTVAKLKEVNKLAPFEALGVELNRNGNGHATGACPFCGKWDHFFVNEESQQWDCKHCGQSGNIYDFLGAYSWNVHCNTPDSAFEELGITRGGIPAEAYKKYYLGYNGENWIMPSYSDKGTVRDIRRYVNGRFYSLEGQHLQLGGARELLEAPQGAVVWLCEGEWDAIALRWLLDQAQRVNDVVAWVPGAHSFKREWASYFAGKIVYICYDNDTAGDDGSKKAGEFVRPFAKKVKYICWPETRPSGYDINDFVVEGLGTEIPAARGVGILASLLKDTHRRDNPPKPSREAGPSGGKPREQPATFQEVLSVFGRWVKIDRDFYEALIFSLAVALSNQLPGEPVWGYLIGPPGGGKSLILLSMQTSEECAFFSTFTAASLVSGFNVSPDPSLIPKINRKIAVFKDGTELLAMHPEKRKEAYGTLRGAFDGHVFKPFGNGINREYRDLHYTLLIGMTPAIHADSQATMGERFLKFEMKDRDAEEEKIRSALDPTAQFSHEIKMQEELCEVVRRFLLQKIDPAMLPKPEEWVVDRLVALSRLVSLLRAQVEREQYGERDIKYRPTHEVGTRIAKQLQKLGRVLAAGIFRVPTINHQIYDLMFKTALDTMVGFHLDIVRCLVDHNNVPRTRHEIARYIDVPDNTLLRRLEDLTQLGVIEARRETEAGPIKQGPIPVRYRLTKTLLNLWGRASGAPVLSDAELKEELMK